MTNTLHLAAWFCYFLTTASAGWIICERSSDWETERWGNSIRAMLLIFSAIGLICFWIFLGNYLLNVDRMPRKDAYIIALASGIICGPIGYWIYRKFISPRKSSNKFYDNKGTSNLSEPFTDGKLKLRDWLVGDLRTILKDRNTRREKRKSKKLP